jgi:hypothetical protein
MLGGHDSYCRVVNAANPSGLRHRSVAGPEPLHAAQHHCSAEPMFGRLPATILAACRGQLLRTLGDKIAAAQAGPRRNGLVVNVDASSC